MVRTKATAAYWIQPRVSANPSKAPRRSLRSRREEASELTPEQTFPTNPQSASPLFKIPREIRENPQSASPLFKVPREIRDYIFKLALTTYEDPTKPCNFDTQVPKCDQTSFPHHRPGHYHHLRTDTALLRTCRAVHSETALLPVSVNTHIFCYPDIYVLSFPMPNIATSYFKRMTSAQLAAVQHIHIFVNRSRLTAEDPGRYISYSAFAELGCLRGRKGERASDRTNACGLEGPYPKTMTITIRNWDWRFRHHAHFDLDNMMKNRHWESVLGGLKELRMELETEKKEKDSMVPIINKLKGFEFDIGGGESLVAENTVKEEVWMGPLDEDKREESELYVATIVWKMRSVDQVSST